MPIDLRSDTVTRPTEEMRTAMASAEVGDDVYGEDRTTNELEEFAADLFGKEAALFVTSGTQGNLAAILTHTNQRRCEIIAEEGAHVMCSEGGNLAHFGGVFPRAVKGVNGVFSPQQVEELIHDGENLHHPRTALICMENTHNSAGGTVATCEQMAAIRKVADAHGLPMYLDGARVFNAAVALGKPVREIAKYFDSVQFCLSKGLSAPIGSMLVGERDFIREARHFRKMLGGGLRQCGVITAAGKIALTKMVDRLAEDHAAAKQLGEGLVKLPGIGLDLATVQSNMTIFSVEGLGMDAAAFTDKIGEKGVLCGAFGKYLVRFVTHRHITPQDVNTVLAAVEQVVNESKVS